MDQYTPVAQKDEWGCGVACVASRLGITYKDAKTRLEKLKKGSVNDEPKGLELDPIVHVLHDAKVDVIADWFAVDFPSGTIVYISGNRPYEDGHYLLRSANRWMDPWSNMARPNQERKAAFIDRPPEGTRIEVALLPKHG